MAYTETLTKQEIYHCEFCGEEISDAAGYTGYTVVGDDEKWHVHCAEKAGFNVQDESDDPEFDYDPDYDGPEEAEDE